MRVDSPGGGANPALSGGDFARNLPSNIADVEFSEFSNIPSAHLTIQQAWQLANTVREVVRQETIDGVVVTHGTDTLEESAYLCDLTVDSPKPVVFTGAMRTASEVGYDGIANLASALRVSSSQGARNLGTLVVLNDEIHAARTVTKTNTTLIHTFQSPGIGRLGHLDYDRVVIERAPVQREVILVDHIEPSVHLLKLVIGMGTELFEHLIALGARGIVLEGLGGGRVPPWWLSSIERAINGRLPVVITSRAGSGRTVDQYGYAGAHRDLARIGCWFADGLNGPKARIKLMVALGTGNAEKYFGSG